MGAHQPLQHRLHGHALVGQEFREAELTARIDQRMLADQILDLGPGRGIERIVGRAHIGEFGIATVIGDDAAAQDRVLGRHGAKRGVGMPEAVAQRGHAALVVAPQLLAVLVEVGDIGEGRVESQLRIAYRRIRAFLERPEIAREGQLLLVGEILPRQHQHGVFIHAGVDGGDLGGRERPRRVDAGQTAADMRGERLDLDRHGGLPLRVSGARPRYYHHRRSGQRRSSWSPWPAKRRPGPRPRPSLRRPAGCRPCNRLR